MLIRLIEDSLNLKSIQEFTITSEDENGKRVAELNKKETAY